MPILSNELVLTDDYETVLASRIQRRYHIRFVSVQNLLLDNIPCPYNHGGAGDLWLLSMGLTTFHNVRQLRYMSRLPDGFRNGPDLSSPAASRKLRGLSIFSGGGCLDRGLEEADAVDFQTVVDFSEEAMHTQRANIRYSDQVKSFCGSVDDYLKVLLVVNGISWLQLLGR